MLSLYTFGLVGQAISGLVIFMLGVLVVSARPRRRYTASFGVFLFLWGGVIILGNLASLLLAEGHATWARRLILLHLACVITSYIPLIHFSATYPATRSHRLEGPLGLALFLTPAILGGGLILFRPELLHQGFIGIGQDAVSDWGPAYPAFAALFFGAILYTIHRLTQHYRTTDRSIERRRVLLVLLAFVLYMAFESAENTLLIATGHGLAMFQDPTALTTVVAALGVAGLIVVARAGLTVLQDRRLPHQHRATIVGAAVCLPILFGSLAGFSLNSPSLPPVLTLGIWRLGAAGLIVYGILRFEVLGASTRIPRTVAAASVVVMVVAGLLATHQAIDIATGSGLAATITVLGGLVGAILMGLSMRPDAIERILRPLADPSARSAPTAAHLEVYEAALARESLDPSGDLQASQALANLREQLGITAAEHALLRGLITRPSGGADAQAPSVGSRVADRYRLEEEVGAGKASRVFLALDELLGRQVVVKVLRPEGPNRERALRRFLTEARVTASIEHPNVVEIHDFGYEAAHPYIVMEHTPEGSLDELLARQGPLGVRPAVRITSDILSGLAHIHEHGIIHRDLKPSNILLTSEGVAKVGDLGLAFVLEPAETQDMADPARGAAGTLAYMSPELLAGSPPRPESDQYAVGAILYETLTGHHYLGLDRDPVTNPQREILSKDPLPPDETVPDELQAVWAKALAKDPADRFASVDEMQAALLRAADAARRSGSDPSDPASQAGTGGQGSEE